MNIINAARDLLIKQDITSFELDILRIKSDKKIIFDTFSGYAQATGTPVITKSEIKDGCTIIKGDIHIILTHDNYAHFYNSGNPGRSLWTLAHEVGHVMLNHTKDDESEERQANRFARELLMPECIILELNRRLKRNLRAEEISRLFGVSQSAAANRLKQIYCRNIFSAYLKEEIIEKYDKLIVRYVKKSKKILSPLVYGE